MKVVLPRVPFSADPSLFLAGQASRAYAAVVCSCARRGSPTGKGVAISLSWPTSALIFTGSCCGKAGKRSRRQRAQESRRTGASTPCFDTRTAFVERKRFLLLRPRLCRLKSCHKRCVVMFFVLPSHSKRLHRSFLSQRSALYASVSRDATGPPIMISVTKSCFAFVH